VEVGESVAYVGMAGKETGFYIYDHSKGQVHPKVAILHHVFHSSQECNSTGTFMEDYEVSEVAKILNEWNPLGDDAGRVNDLNGYKTESADILFELEMSGMNNARVKKVVMQVLNEAFDIELIESECSGAANRIIEILSKKH
jgi:hypothetical protein